MGRSDCRRRRGRQATNSLRPPHPVKRAGAGADGLALTGAHRAVEFPADINTLGAGEDARHARQRCAFLPDGPIGRKRRGAGVRFLISFVRAVEDANDRIGRAVAWFTLATVAICFLVVVLRYVFNIGYRWMQEAYVWVHAVAFMGGAAYTLLRGGHVRVDIFYRNAGARTRAWIDIAGTVIFLMPFLAVVAIWSWPYVAQSWQILESSRDSDGLPGVFLLKTVILVFVALLAFQGLAIMARGAVVLCGRAAELPDPSRHGPGAP